MVDKFLTILTNVIAGIYIILFFLASIAIPIAIIAGTYWLTSKVF